MTFEEALVLVESALIQYRLSKAEEAVLRKVWEGLSYSEIAEQVGYDTGYIRNLSYRLWQLLSKALGEKVTKKNLYAVLKRYQQQQRGKEKRGRREAPSSTRYQSWGEAIDVSVFYGRTEELTTLKQWLVQERCRLITILGIGGIGKTAVSVKLAQQVQGEFEFLIWRSLRNAPPIQDLLTELLKFLSKGQETNLPETVDGISQLINYLRSSRCLLLLDNVESIFMSGERVGYYRQGYEGYGELLKCLGEVRHNSCLVLTSREKPEEIASLEGSSLPVRSLQLKGLQEAEAREILKLKGLLGSEEATRNLIECYRGNPLALKIVATSIQELFAGNINEFVEQGTAVFNGIRILLDQQFNRLSDLEKQIMYWLAINREPVSPSQLQEDIVPTVSKSKLLEALEFLVRRSLIEKTATGFSQEPVVMEFMTERLIEQATAEIQTLHLQFLKSVILEPILASLQSILGTQTASVKQLHCLLSTLL